MATVAVLYMIWWAFLVGCWWGGRTRGRPRALRWGINGTRGVVILGILVVLQSIAFQVEVRAVGLGVESFLKDFFYSAPDLRVRGVFLSTEYFPTFSVWRWDNVLYVPLAFLLYSRGKIRRHTLLGVFLVASICCGGRFTRAPVLQLALVSTIAWSAFFLPSRRAKLMAGIGLLGIGALVFVWSQVRILESTKSSSEAIGEALFGYFGGSVLAYESILDGKYVREGNTYYTLEPANYLLFKLGLNDNYAGVVRPQAEAVVTTNVYTFVDAFTLDGGRAGALIGAALTGILMGWLQHRVATQRSYLNVTAYAYGCYCCFMAYANNEFLRISFPLAILLAAGIDRVVREYPEVAHVASRVGPRTPR
jgi:oligosaccharide repeat unit polymerase